MLYYTLGNMCLQSRCLKQKTPPHLGGYCVFQHDYLRTCLRVRPCLLCTAVKLFFTEFYKSSAAL